MKKWAIYQDTYGKYARHYIDTIEELNKTHLKPFATTITLPIVMNRGLGYSSFELEYDMKTFHFQEMICFQKIMKTSCMAG